MSYQTLYYILSCAIKRSFHQQPFQRTEPSSYKLWYDILSTVIDGRYTLIEHVYGNHCPEYLWYIESTCSWNNIDVHIWILRKGYNYYFLNNKNEQKELLVIQKWYHHAGVGMQDSCEGCCISPFYFSVFARCYVCNKRDFYCIMVKLKWL